MFRTKVILDTIISMVDKNTTEEPDFLCDEVEVIYQKNRLIETEIISTDSKFEALFP